MPDYGGGGHHGMGGDTSGLGGQGGLGPAGGQGQGTTGGSNVGRGMFGPSSDTDSPGHPSNRTNVSPETDIAEKWGFVNRMQKEADKNKPIKTRDIVSLYNTLKEQDIDPNEVSIKNFEKGPLAQKNVVMHDKQRIAQFGEVPSFFALIGIATPCSSLPHIKITSLSISLKYLE